MTTTLAQPFSAQLKARTAAAHEAAETAPFLLALAEGRVTTDGVVGLLQRLVPVYDALEATAATWSGDPCVAPFLVPGLERAQRLRADLAALGAEAGAASPAADAYAARVVVRGASAPAYVAHHYTRYLGDLSGGQVIASALRRAHGLELSFLSFGELRGPVVKRQYREHLDALPWSDAEKEEAVVEAGLAFEHNRALAEELVGEVTS